MFRYPSITWVSTAMSMFGLIALTGIVVNDRLDRGKPASSSTATPQGIGGAVQSDGSRKRRGRGTAVRLILEAVRCRLSKN